MGSHKLLNNMLLAILILSAFTAKILAQNLLENSSFESPAKVENNSSQEKIVGWDSGDQTGISNIEFYSPVDGDWYAYLAGGGNEISQETDQVFKAGETYTFSLWARSINEAGNTTRTITEISIYGEDDMLVSSKMDVNAPDLKGVAADTPNDDGANIWVDGEFRHQFAGVHMYQPISFDPIDDPWLLVEDSEYEKVKGLGWAVGLIIAGENKYIYGTRYRDRRPNFYSSIPMIKALSTDGYRYTWSDPVIVLDHTGTEHPWVEDPHLYYDEDTGKLWMSWGGGICYISEMDPEDGLLIFKPDSSEFYTHPDGYHIKASTWPETRDGWCGDDWSNCWHEGAALYKHNDYWYYLASYGNMNKNYSIRYGRGDSPIGPFYDKHGTDLMKFDKHRNVFGNTILLGEEGNKLVPGHPHIWEEKGIFYMGYDFRKDLSRERDLMGIRKLYWVDGWPTIYMPVTVTINADDYPDAIGKKIKVGIRNVGEAESIMAVDKASLEAEPR